MVKHSMAIGTDRNQIFYWVNFYRTIIGGNGSNVVYMDEPTPDVTILANLIT